MALFPQPTVAGADLNNFFRNADLTDNTNRFSTRVDWQASDKDSVFTRYTWSTRDRNSPGLFPGIADGTQSSSQGRVSPDRGSGRHRLDPAHFKPSLINEFRVGYEHDNSYAKQEPFGQAGGNLVPGVPNNPAFAGGVTMITFTNINTFIGSPNFLPKFQKTQQWQFTDTLSWTHGKHQFKFGTDVHAPQTDNFQDVPGLRGALNFTNQFSCERNASESVRFRHGKLVRRFSFWRPTDRHAIQSVRGESEMVLVRLFRTRRFQGDAEADLESRRPLRFLVTRVGGQQSSFEFRSSGLRLHHYRIQRIAGKPVISATAEAGFFAALRIRLPA